MELVRGLHNLAARHRGCVASIGNYDGVHCGHRAVLGDLVARGRGRRLPVAVVTFEPHPQEYFAGERAPARLMSWHEKIEQMCEIGVDRVLLLRFDRRLADMPAEDFVETVLVEGLGVRYLVVGDDFRFGQGRRGDFGLLERYGAREGFEVRATDTLEVDGERVSSTRIRACLSHGDLARAARLLGRPYAIEGRVRHGQRLGRQWGFPTCNIGFRRGARPALTGIFVVEVEGAGPGRVPGVASLGWRPTVGGTRPLLEVYLLDFDGDLYGRRLRVEFLEKLREETAFDGLEAMYEQIARDVADARAYFARRHPQRRGNDGRGSTAAPAGEY